MRQYAYAAFLNITVTLLLVPFAGRASETVEGAKKDFQAFKTEMETRMATVEKQMTELKSKAKEDGKVAKEKTVEHLETSKEDLHKELEQMKYESEKHFKELKKQFAKSLNTLNSKVQKALKDE